MMKRTLRWILAIIVALLAIVFIHHAEAQQPQVTGAPPQALQGYNSKWVNGVAPGYYPTCTASACSSLSIHIGPGTCFDSTGTRHAYAGANVGIAASSTTYFYLDSSCTVSISTSSYGITTTSGNIPIATVVSTGSAVTSITDDRTYFKPVFFLTTIPCSMMPALTGDVTSTSGTCSTTVVALHLSATPTLCGAGNYARGIDVNGNATGCTTATSGSGTVTSITTTSPITGGTITGSGTLACPNCVTSSSPGAGIAHFAGSTQVVTSSAASLTADVSGILPVANGGTATASPTIVAGTNVTVSGTWPNQTINATASGGGGTIIGATPEATPVLASSTISYNGMGFWFSADCITLSDGSTCAVPSNGTTLSEWVDRSGNYRNLHLLANTCTFNTNQINSQPAVNFASTCKMYFNFVNMWRLYGTAFAVVKLSTTTGNSGLISSNTGGFAWEINGHAGKYQDMATDNTSILAWGTAVTDTNWHQLNITCSVLDNIVFRMDRAADAVASSASNCSFFDSGSTSGGILGIGYDNLGNSAPFKGQIAEVIYYNRILSSTEITQVETYLHTKYGL